MPKQKIRLDVADVRKKEGKHPSTPGSVRHDRGGRETDRQKFHESESKRVGFEEFRNTKDNPLCISLVLGSNRVELEGHLPPVGT